MTKRIRATVGRRDVLKYTAAGLAAGTALGRAGSALAAPPLEFFIWSAAVDWTVCAALFLPLLCRTTARAG